MIEMVIDARRKDLGGFEVGRVLPFHSRRMVGPFIFLDQMGPAEFAPGATATSASTRAAGRACQPASPTSPPRARTRRTAA